MNVAAKQFVKRVAYANPMFRRIAEKFAAPPKDGAYWDDALKGWAATYMGKTHPVDCRNAIISTLVSHHAPKNPAVLDIGCAGGTLSLVLPPFERYLGTDISKHAVTEAAANISKKNVSFEAADMRDFETTDTWDVIIFAELLYFLPVEDAVEVVSRLSKSLSKDGLIIVSMNDNGGKSRAIYKGLAARFEWVAGILWQEKPFGPDYSLVVNRECPPYLIGALKSTVQRLTIPKTPLPA